MTLNEIVGLERYELIRGDFRRRIIALKKRRPVEVGDCISFLFENHDTVLFQIQEMLRAEHIVDIEKIRFEVDTYNAMLPGEGELSATMMIEITERDRIRPELVPLIGIDKAVLLCVGEQFTITARFEGGRSKEDSLSAVQYVRFAVLLQARALFIDERQEVRLVIDHCNYQAHTVLSSQIRRALAADLSDAMTSVCNNA